MSIIKGVIKRIKKYRTPVEYLRQVGANVGEHVIIHYPFSEGSEPWLINIGDFSHFAAGCQFICHDGSNVVPENLGLSPKGWRKYGKISIGKNCFIGLDVTFLLGSEIGDNVIVAAGSIVTKKFPNNVVIGGVPAKIIEPLEDYLEKNIPLFLENAPLGEDI